MRRLLSSLSFSILIASLLPLLTACGPGRATDVPIPPMRETNAMVELVELEVGKLTQDQRRQLHAIFKESSEMRVRIGQQYRGRPRELQEAEKSRLKKLNRVVAGVLTPEQQKGWGPLFADIYNHQMDQVSGPTTPERYNQQQDYFR